MGDEAPSTTHHQRGRVATSDEVRAHAGREHALPVRRRLLPERLTPDPAFVAAERTVNEEVEAAMLPIHPREQRLHLRVVRVVDAHRDADAAPRNDVLGGLVDGPCHTISCRPAPNATPGDVDSCPRLAEHASDAPSCAAARPGNDRHRAVQTRWRPH
jgi:hypothetical protein